MKHSVVPDPLMDAAIAFLKQHRQALLNGDGATPETARISRVIRKLEKLRNAD
jgi:hypothetical protein